MLLTLVNYIIFPQVIWIASTNLNFRLKSERHRSNFIKYVVFFLLSSLFIPLFGLTSFDSLFAYIWAKSFAEIAK